MATDLVNLSNELAGTVERAAASIVAVHARRGIGSSGIVWRDNLILTSSEGIRAEEGIKLLLPDGRVTTARLRGRDSGTDLAVLETDASGLRPLEFAGEQRSSPANWRWRSGARPTPGPSRLSESSAAFPENGKPGAAERSIRSFAWISRPIRRSQAAQPWTRAAI